jgi:hypothetical protein
VTPLRVAIIVADATVPAWIAALVARLQAPAFDTRVYVDPTERRAVRPSAYRLYEWIDGRIFRDAHDALAPVTLPAEPVADLGEVDVAVHLASADPRPLAGATRYGFWVIHMPTFFWEIYNSTTYRTTLEAHLPLGERRLLYESRGRPDVTSLHRSRVQGCWKACAAILRALQQLHVRGDEYLDSRPRQRTAPSPRDGPPRAPAVLRHAVKVWTGVLGRRVRKLVWREEWFVAARRPGDNRFRPLETAPREGLADPFPVEHDGETYVFFERLPSQRGRASIACTRLDGAAAAAGRPITVLAPEYHVSYPFVFRHGSNVYMIPESLENATVDLYRSVEFPSRWAFDARLLVDIRAVDATLLEDDSRLWLFLNAAEAGASINEELHLYSSSDLRGPWVPHPENPVVSDVGCARPAGRIFRRDGALIRPSQDCSDDYGRAVVLNRIDVLTPIEYRETPIERIEPNWAPGLIGTHTYNFTARVEVVDGLRLARRW